MSETGDIVKGLNLPMRILDKATELAKTLFGPAANEVGEMFADQVRFRRMKNQVVIFNKTVDLLEKNNLKARELNTKTLVPLLEQSSLEDEALLQSKWATLIANIVSSPESGLEPKLIKTLSGLSTLEAQVLDFAWTLYIEKRQSMFEKSKASKWPSYPTIEAIRPDMVGLEFDTVKAKFNLTNEFAIICVENLVALGLLKYVDPEVEIEDHGSEVEEESDPERRRPFNLRLSVSATYNRSNDFNLTIYGNYFLDQCNHEPSS